MSVATDLPVNEIETAYRTVLARLYQEPHPDGIWEGRLSSSALATATAVIALERSDPLGSAEAIRRGREWLAISQNAGGGWGDTPDSPANLSTSLLGWAALTATGDDPAAAATLAERWLQRQVHDWTPAGVAAAVLARYGQDRTFSAPILLLCALAGRLGPEPDCWRFVPQLPLELAALPPGLFQWLRLPVVSYALPALVAIGLCRHRRLPSRNALARKTRDLCLPRCLEVLEAMQPENGGFLEAIPLTAFVVMSLAAAGLEGHPVTVRGTRFLLEAMRPDGSWPIDTNLATWVTTRVVEAMAAATPDGAASMPSWQRRRIRQWLLEQQFVRIHPFTRATPGGWSWTHMPGGVPDADDTAGALLALRHLDADGRRVRCAAIQGVRWLLDLQNGDGGMPTFCRGWGRLPFDRSCPDITAHTLRAWLAWRDELTPGLHLSIDQALRRALHYLARAQRDDGAWVPLWFGNQAHRRGENPTYGTAQVLLALQHPHLQGWPGVPGMAARGRLWLLSAQNADHGWGSGPGTPSSIEETALAVRALAASPHQDALNRGIGWLSRHLARPEDLNPAPIGLYFAHLWYAERLYPLVFSLAALGDLLRVTREAPKSAEDLAGFGPRSSVGNLLRLTIRGVL